MQAVELSRFGLEHLALVELPDPEPGPGEVLVQVRAASLNYRDLAIVRGTYLPNLPLPWVPVSDGAGEVVAVGPGVTRVKVGDRVVGHYIQAWQGGRLEPWMRRTSLGGPLPGMLRELAVLHEAAAVPIPAHLSYEEAATLPIAALTAWHALVPSGRLAPGETVLVQGTGGVSTFALQLAKHIGARVIVTSSRDDKLERARALGADALVNYRTSPDWDRRALELTDGVGVDHVIEVGGAGTFARSVRACRVGGHVAVVGFLEGTSTTIELLDLISRGVRVDAVVVGHRQMFDDLNRAIAFHTLRPVIDRVFPLAEARAAFAWLAAGAHVGKVVIRI